MVTVIAVVQAIRRTSVLKEDHTDIDERVVGAMVLITSENVVLLQPGPDRLLRCLGVDRRTAGRLAGKV